MSSGSGLFKTQHPIKAHLLQQQGGISAEVQDVRNDILAVLSPLAALSVDEFSAPAAAGAADLLAATASTVAIQTVLTAGLLAGGIAKLKAFPRNVTFTTAGTTASDAPANVVVTGTYRGLPQTETITLAQTATIATGVKPFSTISSVVYAAGDGAGATVSIGVGAGLGVTMIPKSRAGLVGIFREIVDATVVTTGAITATGLYTPATAPNGTHNYCVYYDSDATL